MISRVNDINGITARLVGVLISPLDSKNTQYKALLNVASYAGVFRGARLSSLPTNEKRPPLKKPVWEASLNGVKYQHVKNSCRP